MSAGMLAVVSPGAGDRAPLSIMHLNPAPVATTGLRPESRPESRPVSAPERHLLQRPRGYLEEDGLTPEISKNTQSHFCLCNYP
jgi:hypothetical protein